ncbi:MAG: hypothetical protein EVA29_03180 [Candidatus Actinomarinales bacterium]|nr:MAG: hypothetical protein EVA29_03180 [Candidatus Actinomarinales bacterium]
MKFEDVKKNIKLIKEQRMEFINNFDNKYENVQKSLIQAKNNNYLNTIRIHKYLTDNKKIGKVKTARFLQEIGLDENTKILDLNSSLIEKIANYSDKE